MKLIFPLAVTIALTAASASAQHSNIGSKNFGAYRPLGEVKAWTFVAKDSVIGQLFSTVKRRTEVNGIDAFEVDQNLDLDYNIINTDRKLSVRSNHYVSENGSYLGDKLEITVNGETEKLELKLDGTKLEGFYTRGSNEIEREFEIPPGIFSADLMFLDMYESFFAMHDFKEGDTISDSIYVPQSMLLEKFTAIIEAFGNISLYNQLRDSAFIIRVIHPQSLILYFNKRKQLVKADYLSRQMKAYLDIVQNIPVEALSKPAFTFTKFMSLVPYYSLYLLFGVVSLLFFAGADTHRLNLYIFIIAGALSFIVAIFTQIPLQTFLGKEIYMNNVNSGGSPYFWALVPALPAGIIQEILKLLVILIALKHLNIEKRKLLFYGAAIGAGFGIVEAAYIVSQVSGIELWSMNLAERGFMILFHTASGVILAYALRHSGAARMFNVIVAILANTLLRYIPVFVQKNIVDAKLVYILQPVLPIILLIYCVSLLKKQEH